MKHLSILIKAIEQSLRINPRNAPLLDTGLMILVIAYGILKIKKSLGVRKGHVQRSIAGKEIRKGKHRVHIA